MPDLEDSIPSEASLEFVQFELAVQSSNPLVEDFETIVVHALEAVDGALLFAFRDDPFSEAQRVAAVALGEGPQREFAFVFMDEDGTMRVVSSQGCPDRLAGFAASYAGVLDRLGEVARP